ncbi:MAG: YbaN family protein, partial [Actinomycetota bacterium]|nr:YbaN family protein [Actinomycetota bacterium]
SAKSFFVKSFLLLLGFIFVGLGFIGIIIPGMPTTVFIILAAASFAKSSPKFEQWILDLPGIGRLVQDHRDGLGMPQKSKAIAITMMVLAVTLSIIFAITSTLIQILVGGVGIIGVWYVGVRVPTKEKVLALRDTEQNH